MLLLLLKPLLSDLKGRDLILDSHAINELYVVREELLDVVAGMMAVDAMAVAHSHEPVVPYPSEVLHDEVVVLVRL